MTAAPEAAFDPEAFRAALREWYRNNHRPLPWRAKPGLYATVVSEFMLQQTRVETVLPYFERWMRALPDFESLAACSDERLLKLWEGLGYYRRAKNLREVAREWIRRHEPPRTATGWREFPGIGPYTAAAVASIACGDPSACVDGNVVRVLARLTGWAEPLPGGGAAAKLFQPLADKLLDRDDPGTHNQAVMELGATVCRRQKPLCLLCPVNRFCRARASGTAASIPRLPLKKTETRLVIRIWCRNGNRLLLHRAQPDAGRLANLHELPTAEALGLDPRKLPETARLLIRKKRAITRFIITEEIHEHPVQIDPRSVKADAGLVWMNVNDLETVALSGPHRRWVRELLAPAKPG